MHEGDVGQVQEGLLREHQRVERQRSGVRGGERRVPANEFFTGVRKTAIGPDDILTKILIPPLPAGTGTAYEKYQLRAASALAVVGAAARLTGDFGVAQADLDAIKTEIETEAQDAYRFAEESPDPDPAKLYDYTYADTTDGGA